MKEIKTREKKNNNVTHDFSIKRNEKTEERKKWTVQKQED